MTKTSRNQDGGQAPDPNAASAADPGGAAGETGSGEERSGDVDEVSLEVEVEAPEPTPDQRIAELEARNKETYDRYLRSVAELDNVRKRARKDVEDARLDAQSRVLREMLPVIDNLERALAHAATTGDGGSGILEGVQLVLRQFSQALERCNVHAVEAEGRPFDPNEHEAVSQVETADAPAGTVVEVLQTGYRIGERLLRPALVVVAKAPPEAPAGPNGRGPHGGESED